VCPFMWLRCVCVCMCRAVIVQVSLQTMSINGEEVVVVVVAGSVAGRCVEEAVGELGGGEVGKSKTAAQCSTNVRKGKKKRRIMCGCVYRGMCSVGGSGRWQCIGDA